MNGGQMVLVAGALLAAGLVASLVAGRLRVPGLLLFLGVGMAVGTDGTGWLPFEDYDLARTIGIIALALILFEGGLTAGFGEIRPVLLPAVSLALVGTLITAAITGLTAGWLLDFTIVQGLLLGAVLSSTDGAAIFSLLRGSTLRRRLARTLEGEAGFNDPIAVLLVLAMINWIERPDFNVLDALVLFARQLGIGAVVGVGIGTVAIFALRRTRLASPGLYPVATIAVAALAFGVADTVHGSGFLAVYIAGLALGTAVIPAKQTVTTFHQGLAWVAQLSLFLTLGLLVNTADLVGVVVEGAAIALLLVLVARPLAAWVATVGLGFSPGERFILGWAGLRGAVPVVLATFPVLAGVPNSVLFFDVVFFAVLLSTLLQGATFEPFARRLGVTTSDPALPRPLAESGTIHRLGAEIVEYPVGQADAIVGARVRDLALPREALVNVIVRDDQAIPPRGSTRLQAGDRLHVLVRDEAARDLHRLLTRWRHGPIGPAPRAVQVPRAHPSAFLVRRWRPEDGDPSAPAAVLGEEVVEVLRTRHDQPGALVLLGDGRLAITGPLLAAGGRDLLATFARRRLRMTEGDDAQGSWWEEVIGAVSG